MKHLLNLCVVIGILFILPNLGLANDADLLKDEPINEVREEIIRLIGHPDMKYVKEKEMESTLHFMITPKNELVVIMVDTKHEFLDRYLKNRLNYKQLPVSKVSGHYAMKIILKNGSR